MGNGRGDRRRWTPSAPWQAFLVRRRGFPAGGCSRKPPPAAVEKPDLRMRIVGSITVPRCRCRCCRCSWFGTESRGSTSLLHEDVLVGGRGGRTINAQARLVSAESER